MTSTNKPAAPPPAVGRRYSTGALVGAGLAGVAVGAAAAFAVTGLVFTVRVELPPPPYPQLSSATPVPPPVLSVTTPSAPSVVPAPLPLPPGPR